MDLSTTSLAIKMNYLIKNKDLMSREEYIAKMKSLKKAIDLSIENSLFQNSVIKWVNEI